MLTLLTGLSFTLSLYAMLYVFHTQKNLQKYIKYLFTWHRIHVRLSHVSTAIAGPQSELTHLLFHFVTDIVYQLSTSSAVSVLSVYHDSGHHLMSKGQFCLSKATANFQCVFLII